MKETTSKTRYILLGLLAHEPQTGYSIKRVIENQFSHFWQESYGQIYPALKMLQTEDLAQCEEPSSEGGRGQKKYTITEKGRQVLQAWLEKEPEIERIRYEILLKISFGENTKPQVLLRHLDTFIHRNERKLAEMKGYLAFFKQNQTLHSDHTYIMLSVLCGKHHYAAMINWATEAKAMIQERQDKSQ